MEGFRMGKSLEFSEFRTDARMVRTVPHGQSVRPFSITDSGLDGSHRGSRAISGGYEGLLGRGKEPNSMAIL